MRRFNNRFIIILILFIICNSLILIKCRKTRKIERAILLGYLLGSSSNNNQQTQPFYQPQYTMPIFMPTNHGGYHGFNQGFG